MGYHPGDAGILTRSRHPALGHCQAGSLTGAVASKRVTEAFEGCLSTEGNRAQGIKAEGSLTERQTGRSGTKVGLSDPAVREWNCRRSTDKSYPGDNRLISPKRSQRRGSLAPRCRLITSWRWRSFQGFGCSPIKVVRELGSERRETVRSLSVVGAGYLRGSVPSTRGPGWGLQWCTSCYASGIAG